MINNNAEKLRVWRAANKDKVKLQKERYKERHPNAAKEYRDRTKERAAETRLVWQRENAEKVKEYCKVWRENNPEKNRAKAMRYRVSKLERTVDWDEELTELVTQEASDKCIILEKLTGKKWHIDHMIPLQGDNVCGLHVWNNLSVILASENIRKGNSFSNSDFNGN